MWSWYTTEYIYYQVSKCKKSFKSQTFSDKLKLLKKKKKKKSTLVQIDVIFYMQDKTKPEVEILCSLIS